MQFKVPSGPDWKTLLQIFNRLSFLESKFTGDYMDFCLGPESVEISVIFFAEQLKNKDISQ